MRLVLLHPSVHVVTDGSATTRGRLGADCRHPWEELSPTVKARASFESFVGLRRNLPASAHRASVVGDPQPSHRRSLAPRRYNDDQSS